MSDPPRQQITAQVHQNIPLCRDHFKLVLRADKFAPTFPGQFIQILCREPDEREIDDDGLDWLPGRIPAITEREFSDASAFLRRPFSLAGRRDGSEAVELDI